MQPCVKNEQRLMIAHFVDSVEVGQQFTEWPLHVTVLPWFSRNENIATAEIELATEHMRACRIALGKKVLSVVKFFGDDSDVPVRLIENSTSLGVMHGMLLGQFHESLENKDYIGGNYNPHLTIRENNDPGESFVLDINKISLVRYGKPQKEIIKNYDLKNEEKT